MSGRWDKATLLAAAERQGVALPYQDDTAILAQPLETGGRRTPNRFAVHPMEGCDGDERGAPGELTRRRYRRYAAGGSGLIWFEATAVVPEGRAGPRQLMISPQTLTPLRRLVAETRRAAPGEIVLILQLTHSGRYARPEPVSAYHNPHLGAGEHRLITDDELDRLQDVFVAAAGLAQEAGFDGVDIKACHGYLVAELLAAFTREASRYGGSFENRTRLLRETAARTRHACPQLVTACRLGVRDGFPHPYGFGADLTEPRRLARELEALGCGLLNVTAGNPHHRPHYGRPFDVPLQGAAPPGEHPLVGVKRLLDLAAGIQEEVPTLPVVGTGYSYLRERIPQVAAGVVAGGGAALVGLGRSAFAYPQLARDVIAHGAADPGKVCVACSRCSQIMHDGGRTGCVVRDAEIYHAEYRAGRVRAAKEG